MISYLSLGEVLNLHSQIIEQSGGSVVVRDLAALESAIAQPRMTNGIEINASVDEQEQVILALASGELGREAFVQWIKEHIKTI